MLQISGSMKGRVASAPGLLLACALALLAGCAGAPRQGMSVPQASVPPMPATRAPVRIDAAEREATVARAMLLVNTPYRHGGNTPEGGFDCSGLVSYVLAQGTLERLPRSTAQWAAASTPVADLQRGDLVFFNTSGAPYSHMGIYVGDGQFVHAPSSGGTVRKDRLASRYFAQRFTGARSVFEH